jgi:hypothetical protein
MDTVLPTDASTNSTVEVIAPAEGNVTPSERFDRAANTLVAGGSAVAEMIISSQVGTVPSMASLGFDQGQSRFRIEQESLEFADLQTAAENSDSRMFAQLARAMKWENHHPSDLRQAIDLALSMEMVPLARQLAQHGRRLFSHDDSLRQVSTVLAPPIILGTRMGQARQLEASQRWLKEHASQFPGQWIAVRRGVLLGAAATLKELYEQIGTDGRTTTTLIVRVLHNGSI